MIADNERKLSKCSFLCIAFLMFFMPLLRNTMLLIILFYEIFILFDFSRFIERIWCCNSITLPSFNRYDNNIYIQINQTFPQKLNVLFIFVETASDNIYIDLYYFRVGSNKPDWKLSKTNCSTLFCKLIFLLNAYLFNYM